MQQPVWVMRMKLAAGFSLLGLGFLIGFALGETRIPEPLQPPPIKAEQRVMAEERVKLDTETCLYTKPDGRTYTLAINAGVRCVTILGGQR